MLLTFKSRWLAFMGILSWSLAGLTIDFTCITSFCWVGLIGFRVFGIDWTALPSIISFVKTIPRQIGSPKWDSWLNLDL